MNTEIETPDAAPETAGYILRLPFRAYVIFGAIMVFGIAVRVWSATGDMWIDEIWSLNHLEIASRSVDTVDRVALFFHANTHALNTVYLAIIDMILGPHAPELSYRMLSVLAGAGTIWMGALIGRRQSISGALIAAALLALSYPLVHYSGEARGYSTMMFAALASTYAMDSYLRTPTLSSVRYFVFFSMLGLASHLTFVVMIMGLGCWALAHIYQETRSVDVTMRRLALLFGLQSLALLLFGALAVGNMIRGGDCCPEPALESIQIIILLTFGINALQGAPDLPFWALYVFMAVAIVWMIRHQHTSWIMLVAVVFLFPLIVVIAEDEPNVIHRYFLLSALLGLMIYAGMLSHLWDMKHLRRTFAGMIMIFYALSNGVLHLQFSQGGRGQYTAVIQDIVSGEDQLQRVTGYPNFSVGSVFNYYVADRRLEAGAMWVPEGDEGSTPVDWYIHGYLDGNYPADTVTRQISGISRTYSLHGIYPQWGLSGDTWALYWLEPET